MPGGYRRAADLPQMIPVFPLDGALLLPRADLPLQIFEPRYLNMVDDAMAGDRLIGMVQTRAGGDRARPNLAQVGCVGRITSYAETSDGRYLITLTGVCRFNAGQELNAATPYRQVRADYGPYEDDLAAGAASPLIDRARFAQALKSYLNHRDLDIDWDTANNAPIEALVNSLAMGLPFSTAEKQALLEAADLKTRAETLIAITEMTLARENEDFGSSLQ
jgi:Lon protease-like protein